MEVSGKRTLYSDFSECTPLCDPCQAVNDDIEACSYCLDCNDYLCQKCTKRHKISKLSLRHKILNRNEMPKKRLSSANINLCAKHGEIFRHYCRAHGEFCCSSCDMSIHVKCHTELLKNVAIDFGKSCEYTLLRGKLDCFSNELGQLKKSIDDASSSLQNSCDQLFSDIQAFRKEINNRIDTLEKNLREDVETLKSSIDKKISLLRIDCSDIVVELEKLSMSLDDSELYNHQELLFISAVNAETSLNLYQNNVAAISKEVCQYNIDEIYLKMNEGLSEVLKSMHTFGNVGRRVSETTIKGSATYFRAKGQINVKCPKDDVDCWITGCADLGCDFVAIADYNNSCIKFVDLESKSVVNHVKLPVKPWDIAHASDKYLVVSCDDKLVNLKLRWRPTLDVHSLSDVNGLLNVDGSSSGVIQNEGKLVVSVLDPNPVILVMKANGNITQKIPEDINEHGNMFTSPFYVTIGANTHDIFVADYDQDKVIRIDVDGRIKATYEDEMLKAPYGLASTKSGAIFVVGAKSSNIHQISESCKKIAVCLDEEDGIEYPQAIELCEESGKLVISHNQYSSSSIRNVLSIYDFH